MSLNPSNGIAARMNPGKTMFPNLRYKGDVDAYPEVDAQVMKELEAAELPVMGPCSMYRDNDVPTGYVSDYCMWGFRRAWYYWVAKGPGIPADLAEEFHKTWGIQVRVNGHCACPSPLEQNHGFAIGLYHIDTQEGLNAFAELLKSIYKE